MTLREFRDLLLTVTEHVYHFEAAKETADSYIVWQEVSGRALAGSDRRQEVIRDVQVDFYTTIEFDPVLEEVLQVLEENGVAFEEPQTGFDPDTRMIRHIIECEVV